MMPARELGWTVSKALRGLPTIADLEVPTVRQRMSAVELGNRMRGAEKIVANRPNWRPLLGLLSQTGKPDWPTRTALRSRWRRYESCRGRRRHWPTWPNLMSSAP